MPRRRRVPARDGHVIVGSSYPKVMQNGPPPPAQVAEGQTNAYTEAPVMVNVVQKDKASAARKKVLVGDIAQAIESLFETLRPPHGDRPFYRAYPAFDSTWELRRAGETRGGILFSNTINGPVLWVFPKSKIGATQVSKALVVPPGFTVFRWIFAKKPAGEVCQGLQCNGRYYWMGEPRYVVDDPVNLKAGEYLTSELWATLGIRTKVVQPTCAAQIKYNFSRPPGLGFTTVDHYDSRWAAVHIRFQRAAVRNVDHLRRYIGKEFDELCGDGVAIWRFQPVTKKRLQALQSEAQKTGSPEARRRLRAAVDANYRELVIGFFNEEPETNPILRKKLDVLLSHFRLTHHVIGYSFSSAVPAPSRNSLLFANRTWLPCNDPSNNASNDSWVRVKRGAAVTPTPCSQAQMPMLPMEQDCAAIVGLYGINTATRWGYRDPFAWCAESVRALDLTRTHEFSDRPNTMTPRQGTDALEQEPSEHPPLTRAEMLWRFEGGQQLFWSSCLQPGARALTIDCDIRRGRKKLEVGGRWLDHNIDPEMVRTFERNGLRPVFRLSGTGVYIEYFFMRELPTEVLDKIFLLSSRLFVAEPVEAVARGAQPPQILLQRGRKSITLDMVSTHGLTRLPGSVHHHTGRVSRWVQPSACGYLEIKDFYLGAQWIKHYRTSSDLAARSGTETTPIISLPTPLVSLIDQLPKPLPTKGSCPAELIEGNSGGSPNSVTSVDWISRGLRITSSDQERLVRILVAKVESQPRRGPAAAKGNDRMLKVVQRVVRLIAMKEVFALTLRELANLVGDSDTKQVKFVLEKILRTGVISKLSTEAPAAPEPTALPRSCGRHTVRGEKPQAARCKRPQTIYQVDRAVIAALLSGD